MTFHLIPSLFGAGDYENIFFACMLGIHKASATINHIFNISKAFWHNYARLC